MKKYICLLLLFSLVLLPSCSAKDPSAMEIFSSITEKLPSLPRGSLYISGRAAGDEHYMSPALFSAVFDKKLLSYVEEYVIYLSSFSLPCEIAVFKCYSSFDRKVVERACMRRLDHLRSYFGSTEHQSTLSSPIIESSGRTVIFIISPHAEDLSGIVK